MELLIAFALKSVLIAGATLGVLHLLRRRSAAERSMIAHFGLLALLVVPFGCMLLPQVVIEAPVLAAVEPAAPAVAGATPSAAIDAAPAAAAPASNGVSVASLWPLLYGFPAALLLAVTLLAVLRLLALRARASVMVEPSWLSALAHAQRRMNFKHGTALLSSSDLKSPISWGVMRPVILLNDEAIQARHEAEAIIAHELAHVRGLDWAKLLLARVVTAIFWFNPLVWILSREAHQLREETADDAVLAANVESADYAQLLVGVARHECRGMLLASHGVAPGKGSLSRRVRRVLDSSLPRTPVARGFAAGVALGSIAAAAPLAALTFTSGASRVDTSRPYYVSAPTAGTSLPSIVADSVAEATAVTGQAVAAQVTAAITGEPVKSPDLDKVLEQQIEKQAEVRLALAHPHPETRRVEHPVHSEIDRAIELKALGVTPDYAARLRAAAPRMRIEEGDLMSMKAVGVTPGWLNGMLRAGYQPRDVDDVVGARAVGVSPAYVADLAAAGYRNIPLDDLTSMRAIGVTGAYIRQLRSRGYTGLSIDKLVEMKAVGLMPEDLRGDPRTRSWQPPGVPRPPRVPDPVDPPEIDEPEPDGE